ncbi:MAG: heme A synthase [Candidatus Nanopelagicales bacterium]
MTTEATPARVEVPLVRDGRAPKPVRGIYVANLVAQGAIVVTGGIVRLTGSGLGCPTWPRCTEGSFVPTPEQAEGFHKLIEFGNRTLTFVLGLFAVAAIVAALWDARRRRREDLPSRPVLTRLAFVPFLGTVAQAVLGGITVLTGLNPLVVGSHFLLSMVIVLLCTMLVHRAAEYADEPVVEAVRREIRIGVHALTFVMAVVVVLGVLVTASGPHAGDAETPRLGLDPQLISWLHADVVFLALGLLAGLIVALRASRADTYDVAHDAVVVLLLMLAQAGVGYVQYFTGLPWVLVAVHLLGSVLVWWATARLLLRTRRRGVPEPVPA